MEEQKIGQSVKASGLIQLVAILMCIGGVLNILVGMPMLFLMGLGLVPIAVGALFLYYGVQVWHVRKKAYMGTMVITGVGLIVGIFSHQYISAVLSAIILYVIYSNQNKFVN